MNIENEFIIVLLNPEICQCVWKIFFLFLFFIMPTVQPRNMMNNMFITSNSRYHKGQLNMCESVQCLQWHSCLAASLWYGHFRLTRPSVDKLKTCFWTYPEWLGMLHCQLLTRQRKLQLWPRGAWQWETSNFAYMEKKVGEERQGGDEAIDMYDCCSSSSSEQPINYHSTHRGVQWGHEKGFKIPCWSRLGALKNTHRQLFLWSQSSFTD